MKNNRFFKIALFSLIFVGFNSNLWAQNNKLNQLENTKNNSFKLTIDKTMTDEALKQDEADAKKFDFEVNFSGVKRNDKKEITAIKITYKDKDGNAGNYAVASDNPIETIELTKQFNGKGNGLVNINSGAKNNNSFFADGFNSQDFGNSFGDFFNNDMFKGLMQQGNQLGLADKFKDIDLDKLKELQKENFGGFEENSKIFMFKDGKMLGDNPDMKLEEEITKEDGTIVKKYSDGKGNTMMFSEKSSGSINGSDLEKLKDLEKTPNNYRKELDEMKLELENLKKDLKKEKKSK